MFDHLEDFIISERSLVFIRPESNVKRIHQTVQDCVYSSCNWCATVIIICYIVKLTSRSKRGVTESRVASEPCRWAVLKMSDGKDMGCR